MLERLADQIRPLVSWRKPKKSKVETSSPSKDTSKPTAETDNAKTTDAVIETSSDKAESDAASSKELSADDASLEENATTTSVDASETSSTTSEQQATKPEPKATKTKETSETDQPVGSTGDGGFIIIPEMMSIMGCSADELGVVLRSLGFAPDQKRQTKPLNDKTPSEEASQKSSEQASCDALADGSTSDDVEVETSQTIGTDAVSKDKQEEETVILVWRPRRKSGFNRSHGSTQKRHQNKRHQALDGEGHKNRSSHKHRGKKSHKNDGGKGGNGFKKNNGNKKQSQIREKKIDPDSPFAKLQALKDQIENKAG